MLKDVQDAGLGLSEQEVKQLIESSESQSSLIAQLKAIFEAFGRKEALRAVYLRELRKILKPLQKAK